MATDATSVCCIVDKAKLGFYLDTSGDNLARTGVIQGLGQPTKPDQAANKRYVDDRLAGVDPHEAVDYVTYVTSFPAADAKSITFTDATDTNDSASVEIKEGTTKRVLFMNIGGDAGLVDAAPMASVGTSHAANGVWEVRRFNGENDLYWRRPGDWGGDDDTLADDDEKKNYTQVVTDSESGVTSPPAPTYNMYYFGTATIGGSEKTGFFTGIQIGNGAGDDDTTFDADGVTLYTPETAPMTTRPINTATVIYVAYESQSVSRGAYVAVSEGMDTDTNDATSKVMGRGAAFILQTEKDDLATPQKLFIFRSSNLDFAEGVDDKTIEKNTGSQLALKPGNASHLLTYAQPATDGEGVQPAHLHTNFVKYLEDKIDGRLGRTDMDEVGGALTARKDANLAVVTVAETLDVTGITSLTNDLRINTNKFTVHSASGNTVVDGTLQVDGATAALNADTSVDGTFDVKSGTNNRFSVTDTANLYVPLTVGNTVAPQDTTLHGALTTNGVMTVHGTEGDFQVTTTGQTQIGAAGMTAEGDVHLSAADAEFTVAGRTTFQTNVNVQQVENTQTGQLVSAVLETKAYNGNTTFKVDAGTGDTSVYGTLTVGENEEGQKKATNLNGALNVLEATTLQDTLEVNQGTTLNNGLSVTAGNSSLQSMSCTSANCTGNLSVDAASTLTGNVTAKAELAKKNGTADVFRVDNTDARVTANLRVDDGDLFVRNPNFTTFRVMQNAGQHNQVLINGVNLNVSSTNHNHQEIGGTATIAKQLEVGSHVKASHDHGLEVKNRKFTVTDGNGVHPHEFFTVESDGDTNIEGTLDVGDKTTLDELEVNGASTLKESLTVADGKDTILGGTLTVKQESSLKKTLTIGGTGANLVVKNGAGSTANAKFTVDGATGETDIQGTLDVAGAVNADKGLTVKGADNTIFAVKNASDQAKFTVVPASGNTTIEGTLIVNNNTNLVGALEVAGASTLNDSLTVADAKATTLGGTLTVKEASTLQGALTVETDQATTLKGTLTVQGAKDTTLGGDLEVTGASTLTSTLAAQGMVTLGTVITGGDSNVVLLQTSHSSASERFQVKEDGSICATNLTCPSDVRLKENITIESGSDILEQLADIDCLTYDMNGEAARGVSAQALLEKFPELVKENNGYLAVNYMGLTAACVGAINELNAKIAALSA